MQKENSTEKNDIDFPAECTFKAVFRNREETETSIRSILKEKNVAGSIAAKASKNGKFISYTVIARYEDDDQLQDTCRLVSSLQGYMTLF